MNRPSGTNTHAPPKLSLKTLLNSARMYGQNCIRCCGSRLHWNARLTMAQFRFTTCCTLRRNYARFWLNRPEQFDGNGLHIYLQSAACRRVIR
jgi:hypothetical protein